MEINYMNKLFESGLVCALHVCKWTGMRQLTPETLGLGKDDVPDSLYSLGRERLIPKDSLKEIKSAETAARALIAPPNGFRFIMDALRFIPKDRVKYIDDHLTRIKQERFLPAVMAFQDRYPTLRYEMMRQWESHLMKLANTTTFDNDKIQGVLVSLDDYYPSQDRISSHFTFYWDWVKVSFPDGDSLSVLAETEDERREIARRNVEQYNRRVSDLLGDMVSQMRDAAVEICERWAEDLNAGGALHYKRFESMREFIGKFKTMNFYNDSQFSQALDELERTLPQNVTDLNTSDAEAKQRVQSAIATVRRVASDMTGGGVDSVVHAFLHGARNLG